MAKQFFIERIPKEVKKLTAFIKRKPIVIFMLGKKLSGKSTYAAHLSEATDGGFSFYSVGDMMRDIESVANTKFGASLLYKSLRELNINKTKVDNFLEDVKRIDQKKLYPTDIVYYFLKLMLDTAIEKDSRKSLIIDGFPRSIEQIEYALKLARFYQKAGMEWFFVEINCPNSVLEARISGRRFCPKCNSSKNIKLLLTKDVGYDESTKEFYLLCDTPSCKRVRMIRKPGDELGIKVLEERNKETEAMIEECKKRISPLRYIIVYNSLPVEEASSYNEEDFTKEAKLKWNAKDKKVEIEYIPWIVKDDNGKECYSRYSEPVAADLIKELFHKLERLTR